MNFLLQTPAPDKNKVVEYYKSLNFKIHDVGEKTFAQDGNQLIEINSDHSARSGIVIYGDFDEAMIETLKSMTDLYESEKEIVIGIPSGTRIYWRNENINLPVASEEKTYLGNCAGVCLETVSMSSSQKIWEVLGFKIEHGNPDQGWMSMKHDSGFGISLMGLNACPHMFFNPSLTYFNGKEGNPKVIQKIRDLNIPITEEITVFNDQGIVDNIIIRDPGGLGFFVYND